MKKCRVAQGAYIRHGTGYGVTCATEQVGWNVEDVLVMVVFLVMMKVDATVTHVMVMVVGGHINESA
jgi:hypothetical protein